MKTLCIIPARGGSKRIPRKNIKSFLGKPIIAYSIETAMHSGIFDEVMISTDDEEIASIAQQFGARIPFMRSQETANDFATTADVINEVLTKYRERGEVFDSFCCLYATAPFVTTKHLQEAFDAINNEDIDACFTMVQYSYPIQRSLKVNHSGFVEMTFPEYIKRRSQDLTPIYHDAGQFYFVNVHAFEQEQTLWCKRTVPLILSELEVQDLDTQTDWQLAEMKYKLTRRETKDLL